MNANSFFAELIFLQEEKNNLSIRIIKSEWLSIISVGGLLPGRPEDFS